MFRTPGLSSTEKKENQKIKKKPGLIDARPQRGAFINDVTQVGEGLSTLYFFDSSAADDCTGKVSSDVASRVFMRFLFPNLLRLTTDPAVVAELSKTLICSSNQSGLTTQIRTCPRATQQCRHHLTVPAVPTQESMLEEGRS